MLQWLVKYLRSYTNNQNMSKGYKKEYIDKVKTKFNDLQSSSKGNTNSTGKPQDASHGKVLNSNRVVKLG